MRKTALALAVALASLASPALAGARDMRAIGEPGGYIKGCRVGRPNDCREIESGTMLEFVRFDSGETGNRQGVVFRFEGEEYVTTFDCLDINKRNPL